MTINNGMVMVTIMFLWCGPALYFCFFPDERRRCFPEIWKTGKISLQFYLFVQERFRNVCLGFNTTVDIESEWLHWEPRPMSMPCMRHSHTVADIDNGDNDDVEDDIKIIIWNRHEMVCSPFLGTNVKLRRVEYEKLCDWRLANEESAQRGRWDEIWWVTDKTNGFNAQSNT